MKYNKKA